MKIEIQKHNISIIQQFIHGLQKYKCIVMYDLFTLC